MAALCEASDYRACGELGCLGDDQAAALARSHGVDRTECSKAFRKALLEWRRTPDGPGRARFPPIAGERQGPIGARPTKPFDAVRFQYHGGRNRQGWPRYDVYNLNDRAVTELSVCLYAYADRPGGNEQVAGVAGAVNIEIPPDAIVPLPLDAIITTDLPAGTIDVLLDYDRVRFQGDPASTKDAARCPAQRAYDQSGALMRW